MLEEDLVDKLLMTNKQKVVFQQFLDALHACEREQIYLHADTEGNLRGYNGEHIQCVLEWSKVKAKDASKAVHMTSYLADGKVEWYNRSFQQPFISAIHSHFLEEVYAIIDENRNTYSIYKGTEDQQDIVPEGLNFIVTVDSLPDLLEAVRAEFGNISWDEEPEDVTAGFRYGYTDRYCYSENGDMLYIVKNK